MTPASTMAMNSVYQSYVCSAWASKIHSLNGSEQSSRRGSHAQQSKSRRASEWNNMHNVIVEEEVGEGDLGDELTVSVIESSTTQQQKEDHQIDTISPQDLFDTMKGPGGDKILVIDVRGKDHDGGHIPNSIHITTKEVCKNPGYLVSEIRQRKVSVAVFTCMYSVLRARKCSNAIQAFQKTEQSERHSPVPVQLKLLAGGFHGYINAFADNIPEHVEDYKEDCWTKGPENLGMLFCFGA